MTPAPPPPHGDLQFRAGPGWEAAALAALGGKRQRTQDQKKIRELERELNRKDKALAETAALLVLAKKARALWGDEDDEPTGRGGK